MKKSPKAEVELVKSSGGIFDITVDGKLKFSKDETGRFPDQKDIAATVA